MKKSAFAAILLSFAFLLPLTACGETGSDDTNKTPDDDIVSGGDDIVSGGEENKKPDDTGVSSLTFDDGIREDYINWYGRNIYDSKWGTVACDNSASGFEVSFWGTGLTMTYVSEQITGGVNSGDCYLCIQIDGDDDFYSSFTKLPLRSSDTEFTVAKDLKEGSHTIAVYKATENMCVSLEISEIETDGFFVDPPAKPELKIEAYGDSITAGMSVMREVGESEASTSKLENGLLTYAAQTAHALGAQYNAFCVSGYRLGVYDEASYAAIPSLYTKYSPNAYASNIWDFSKYEADVVIVDLGTNDIIERSGKEDFNEAEFRADFKAQYQTFITNLRAKYADAYIVICCGVFPNYKTADIQGFNSMFSEIAQESGDDKVSCVTFASANKGHPTYTENAAYSLQLSAHLRTLLNLE